MEEIAAVYSRSLFDVSREQGNIDLVREQLGTLADALDENRDLAVFFFSPYFSSQEKEAGFDAAVSDADPSVRNFVRLLIENHRMPVIFRIRRDFDALWEEENKLLPVEITSAIELDADIVSSLGRTIGEKTGRQVQLTAHVEPDILGGLILRVGNSILDASVRNRLHQLSRQVAHGAS
jgi:F-type H+-transporting ATPase subunit delta